MKTTHQKQIKTFLKKESDKIYLPFLKTFSKNGKVAQVFQKMMDILPTLKKAKEKIEKPENNLLSPITVNTKPKVMTPMTMKSSQTVVNLPQVDKEKLVSMVKNKQILNKLESPAKNQYVLTLPAYEDGKNVDAWKKNIINVTSEEHAKGLKPESGNNDIKDTGRNLETAKADALVAASEGNNTSTSNSPVADRPTSKLSPVTTPVSEIKAKLEPTAKTAGGSEGAKITVIGDKDKEASLVGEKGVEAIGKTEVLPKKEIDDVTSAAANTQANAAEPEEAGSGAKRGGEVLKDIATTAMSFIPGLGAAAGAMKGLKGLGAVGKMANMAKGMGGGSPLSAMSSGGGGGMGGMLGAAGGGGGGMGGMLGAAGGGGGGMLGAATKGGGLGGVLGSVGGGLGGLAGAAAMATPMGMALAAAPAIGAAAGGIASGVGAAAGGLAAGIGSAVGGIGGALIGGIFGNGNNKETKQPVVVSSNSAAPTNITNITHQYDVYRKTAEDSFMLPNWRREYG
jgi:hypothetical protein